MFNEKYTRDSARITPSERLLRRTRIKMYATDEPLPARRSTATRKRAAVTAMCAALVALVIVGTNLPNSVANSFTLTVYAASANPDGTSSKQALTADEHGVVNLNTSLYSNPTQNENSGWMVAISIHDVAIDVSGTNIKSVKYTASAGGFVEVSESKTVGVDHELTFWTDSGEYLLDYSTAAQGTVVNWFYQSEPFTGEMPTWTPHDDVTISATVTYNDGTTEVKTVTLTF
ncbi:MAG: hypothetical protein LBN02_01580 [Oscillospiraceae bacterium]|jgi:hypothetical protein|nr:hypothetical protein [Oscillospiraceae bacterium]